MKRFNILLIVLFLGFSFNLLSGCEEGVKKEDYEMLKIELQKVQSEKSNLEKKNQELENELSALKDENQKLLAENEELKSMQPETEPMESPTPEPSVTPVPEDEWHWASRRAFVLVKWGLERYLLFASESIRVDM